MLCRLVIALPNAQRASSSQNATDKISRIELEMRPCSGRYPKPIFTSGLWEQFEHTLTKAFLSQPLVGNILISPEQKERLHTTAKNLLMNARTMTYSFDYGLDTFYSDILVLNTVLLLRNWSGDGDANCDYTGLWEYIFNQYALRYNEDFGGSLEYNIFKSAIKKSLCSHQRLFLQSGQKYYTSLLVHAISPKRMFYALFDQIFAFYSKTLNYQWYKDDPAFRAFAYTMKDRFEGKRSRMDEDIYIKSVQSSSAIQALFTHCPEYMIELVDKTVRDMDALVANGSIRETSYIDTLLINWYEKRSREERSAAKRERANAGTERVVTSFSSIRSVYRYDNEKVSLIIPSIRLGKKLDSEPRITIYRYQDDVMPYSEKLRYFGDYFCITSSKTIIPIEALLPDNAELIEPRVIISYADMDIYDSGSRLYRDAIVFGDDGGETVKRPNEEYVNLFMAICGNVQGVETAPDCNRKKLQSGYMYRILIDDGTILNINGKALFPIEQVVSELTLSLSVAPVRYCKYVSGGSEYTIFKYPPTLGISSEIPLIEKRYRLTIDDTYQPLAGYQDDCRGRFSISLPSVTGIHELRIIDNTTQHPVYSLTYTVIESFSLGFDGIYYYDGFNENGCLDITDADGSNRYPYEIQQGQNSMLVPYGQGELSIDIPIFRCCLNGVVIFNEEEQTLWFEDIPMFSLLEIDAPRGYNCSIVIGQRTYESSRVEIGNEIRAKHDDDLEMVSVNIQKGDEPPRQINLFSIVFEPTFKSPPLLLESEELLWCAENNFIGDAKSEFEIHIYLGNKEVGKYSVHTTDEILQMKNPLVDGIYDYTILYKTSGFFAKYEELAKYQLWVGDNDLFRFNDHAIIVTEAIIDNERFKLKPASGIITKLRYIGELGLNGEALHYPCYEGFLQYKYEGNMWPYATRDYERNGVSREQVNPIKLWLINDYTISLRNPTDAGLYVKRSWESITDRVPVRRINKEYVENDYDNPDYYSFKVITISEVENV